MDGAALLTATRQVGGVPRILAERRRDMDAPAPRGGAHRAGVGGAEVVGAPTALHTLGRGGGHALLVHAAPAALVRAAAGAAAVIGCLATTALVVAARRTNACTHRSSI